MSLFSSLLDKRTLIDRFTIYIVLLGLCVVFATISPLFASWENLKNILLASSTIGLLTISTVFVIGAAGLDLSVGSTMALSGAAASLVAGFEVPWQLILLTCLLTGALAGLINGLIITRVGIPAFIVTLGMLSVQRGAALILTDGRPVYGMHSDLVFFGQGTVLGLPVPAWLFLIAGVVMQVVLSRTTFGIYTLSIGDNEKAVYNAGIKVKAHKTKLYILSGCFAALAGLVFMGRMNAADPNAGLGYELAAITGAILGGTRLFGGRASVIGGMVGALVMGVLQNGLTLLAVPSYYQQVAIGAVLILAVSVDRLAAERS